MLKTVEKVIPKSNTRISIHHTIYHTSRTSDPPKIIIFSFMLGSKIEAKTDSRKRHPQKVTTNGHRRHQKGPKEPPRGIQTIMAGLGRGIQTIMKHGGGASA